MSHFPVLKSLTISDFRSISGEWTVPLDAGAILVHGYNGAGKTSLLSALELACTGSIAHLDEAGDGEYKRHLHHRGMENGQVSLTAETSQGESRTTTLRVDDSGVEGQRMLSESESEFFTERCFLPQATLARLLEIYVPREGRSGDTGLIRFVKELLGLDALDSLIEGLDSTGHIARAERVSSDWQVAKTLLEERVKAQTRSSSALESVRVTREAHRLALAALLTPSHDDTQVETLTTLASTMLTDESDEDDRIAALREAALRLDGVEALLDESGDSEGDIPPGVETAADLQERYSDWQANRGRALIEWATVARPELSHDVVIDASVLGRALNSAIVTAGEEARTIEASLVRVRDVVSARRDLAAQLMELQSELAAVNASRADVMSSSTASELSGILAALVEHTVDSVCPACDQPFLDQGGLREHIRGKVLELNDAAASMLELESARSELVRAIDQASRRVAELDDEVATLGTIEIAEAQLTQVTIRQAQLTALLPLQETGEALQARLAAAEDREASLASTRALLDRAVAEISYVGAMVKIPVPRGTPRQQIAALRSTLQRELDQQSRRREVTDEVAASLAGLRKSSTDLAVAEAADTAARKAVEFLAGQVSEARRRKEAASVLRKRAEELRAQVSNRVFDDRLNGAWSRLFRTLVPTEPFVPQFVQRSTRPRVFDVGLETIHRDGTRAASPGAMLSQGNANTAALSLFLALHFAVAPRLPWLLFDDPVQSMDDLHVSNFAALVKQLIRNNGRQVIIAIHQRELFDYLMLELTPGSPDEEILGIKLDRSFGKTSITHTRVKFDPHDALGPSTAA